MFGKKYGWFKFITYKYYIYNLKYTLSYIIILLKKINHNQFYSLYYEKAIHVLIFVR